MPRPGIVGMRGSMAIRLRPCMRSSISLLSSTPPPFPPLARNFLAFLFFSHRKGLTQPFPPLFADIHQHLPTQSSSRTLGLSRQKEKPDTHKTPPKKTVEHQPRTHPTSIYDTWYMYGGRLNTYQVLYKMDSIQDSSPFVTPTGGSGQDISQSHGPGRAGSGWVGSNRVRRFPSSHGSGRVTLIRPDPTRPEPRGLT